MMGPLFGDSELEVPSYENGNPFEQDALQRRGFAENLTKFIGSIPGPLVLALDSPWGTGKTTFVRMWKELLREAQIPCVSFNAWETDFSTDPLVPLIGEFGSAAEELVKESGNQKCGAETLESVKRVGDALLKRAISGFVSKVTLDIVDVDGLLKETAAKSAQGVVADHLKEYQETKASMVEFGEELTELVNLLNKGKEGGTKPLVFIVDELDRCRPDYALRLLERVKHLFEVKGVVFVLALDMTQLAHAAKVVYGAKMNTDGYLRRFISLDLKLPPPPPNAFAKHLLDTVGTSDLLKSRLGKKVFPQDNRAGEIVDACLELPDLFSLSLRDHKQLMHRLNLLLCTRNVQALPNPILALLMLLLRKIDRDVYDSFAAGSSTANDVLAALKGGLNSGYLETREGQWVHATLLLASSAPSDRDTMKDFERIDEEDSYEDELREMISAITNRNRFHGHFDPLDIGFLYSAIETIESLDPEALDVNSSVSGGDGAVDASAV